jgi:WD40 repeat protein
VNKSDDTVLNRAWRLLHSYSGHLDSIECLSSNSNILVSGSADTSLRLWDLEFKKMPKVIGSHSGLSLLTVGWVRDVKITNNLLISGSNDHLLKLWNLNNNNNEVLTIFEGHSGSITSLHFDKEILLSGSIDQSIIQWDIETSSILNTFIDIDSELILKTKQSLYDSLVEDEDFKGWNMYNEYGVGSQVNSICYYDKLVAGGYGDGSIRFYDIRSSKCVKKIITHTNSVFSIHFNDKYLYSSSMNKFVVSFIFLF